MATKEPAQVLNLSDITTKRRLMSKIQSLQGLYEITIHPRKITRSLNANAYYFAAVVVPFREWLQENWGESFTTEQAHSLLKTKVLGAIEKTDTKTGEVFEIVPTTHNMEKHDFGEYIEKSSAWLAEFCQIVVLPPEMFYEQKDKRK
jgi:hypothetical protein